MFSDSALLHISICLTGLVLLAKGLTHTMLERNRKLSWKLRGQRRKLDELFKKRRKQRAKLERKRAKLADRREVLEQKLDAIQWAGVAQWADFDAASTDDTPAVADLAAASA